MMNAQTGSMPGWKSGSFAHRLRTEITTPLSGMPTIDVFPERLVHDGVRIEQRRLVSDATLPAIARSSIDGRRLRRKRRPPMRT